MALHWAGYIQFFGAATIQIISLFANCRINHQSQEADMGFRGRPQARYSLWGWACYEPAQPYTRPKAV